MLDFTYENQTRMIFGKNALASVGREIAALDTRVLIVYGGGSCIRSGLLEKVKASLKAFNVHFVELGGVEPNPKMGLAYQGIEICKQENIGAILAVGGGSVIDTCKTIGMGACYGGDPWDFYTGTQAERTLPLGVVLTIPAAGSESSMDAVMTKEEGHLKRASCAKAFLRPKFSIMDPQLTFTLPPYQTACGACDIIAHVLERYFTPTPNVDVTDRLCEGLIVSVMGAAKAALVQPHDYSARAEIMLAGTYAHNNMVGVGRAQDWASHGMGHEISALTDAAHGATLAVMFPAWMKYVFKQDIQRFAQFANRVFNIPYMPHQESTMAQEGIARFEGFLHAIGLPTRLSDLGISPADIPTMASKCHKAGSFVALDEDAITQIYHIANS